jgi:hypothetical protein
MKKIIIILLLISNFGFCQQNEITDFINNLPELIIPTDNYHLFEYEYFYNLNEYSLPEKVSNQWNGTLINYISYNKDEETEFYSTIFNCIGKYNLRADLKTIIIKTHTGTPESFYLINLVEDGGKLKPISKLEILGESDASVYFSIDKNQIKIYNLTELSALGVLVSINSNGKFIIESTELFEENDWDGILKY